MIKNITFEVEGTRCAGRLYRPEGSGPLPLVVMGAGLGGVMECGPAQTAARFAKAGLACLTFDYRHFGDSAGEPRQFMSVRGQLADWEGALGIVSALPGVDPTRVALWGTSFGGGHVLTMAARHPEVAAVVARIPAVDFMTNALRTRPWVALPLMAKAVLDRVRQMVGLAPVTLPLVAGAGERAVMSALDHAPGYRRLTAGAETWVNRITAGFLLTLPFFRPIRAARRIQSPVLMLVGDRDTAVPVDRALAAAARIPDCRVLHYDCGHFDIEFDDWNERSIGDQIAVLTAHLQPTA